MQQFATLSDVKEAVGVFISQFTGGKPGTKTLVLAATNVLSYGAGIATGGFEGPGFAGTVHQPVSAREAAEDCQRILDIMQESEGRGKFDPSLIPWDKLFSIALMILKKYVPWLPVPVMPEPPSPMPIKAESD